MQKFFSITNPDTNESVAVEDRNLNEDTNYLDDIICEVCELGDNEQDMLLCDECERGFHTNCIGIMRIPYLENWFCSQCIRNQAEDVQNLQRQEIIKVREPEIPQKRSRRNCRSPVAEPQMPRRSDRLRRIN